MAIKALLLPVAAALLALCGCANRYTAPLRPPSGGVVTDVTVPLTVDCGGVPAGNLKLLTSYSDWYLFVPYPTVDMSWQSGTPPAAFGGRPKTGEVVYAEMDVFTILSMFGKYTVRLYAAAQ